MGRVIRQSVQFVMTILISKNVKYSWKTEVRYYIRRSYTMDALVISPKNTMQNFVPIEGCAKFALEDTPQYCMETMKTLIPRKTNQKE